MLYKYSSCSSGISDYSVLAENICLLDGSNPVDVPIVAEGHGLVNFNDLFCRLSRFHALTKSQGMATLVISPAKANTITELLESTFPAIKSTKSSPTPYVTPVTAPNTSSVSSRSSTPSPPFRRKVQISVHFVANQWLAKNWNP